MAVLVTLAAGEEEQPDRSAGQQPPGPGVPVQLTGVGLGLKPADGGFEVFRLLPNGPAALSGEVDVRDTIVGIAEGEGEVVDVGGKSLNEIVRLIRGPEGTEVRLTIVPAESRFVKRKIVALRREPLQGGKLIGKRAPSAAFTLIPSGEEQNLSEFSGKIVILEFWSTTCAPCIEHINEMQAYPESYPAWKSTVALVTINIDQELETAEEFIKSAGWSNTEDAWGGERAARAFEAQVLPMVMVIDERGEVVAAGNPKAMNIPKIVSGVLEGPKGPQGNRAVSGP